MKARLFSLLLKASIGAALACLAPMAGMGSVVDASSKAGVVALARHGEAMLPIVIPATPSEETRQLAAELAEGLRKITGAEFRIVTSGEAVKGIVMGTAGEWPGLIPQAEEGMDERYTRDDYLLRSGPHGLSLVGRSATGLSHALWGFLHSLGFRQFFPGPHWEIWPRQQELSVQVDRYERPDYYFREVTMLEWQENRESIAQWKVRNRMASGFRLKTGHAYDAIIRRHAAFFKEHPQAVTPENKLDPTYPGVIPLVIGDALEQLRHSPDSVSMDPSDHGGWRADSPLGSPSNQAVTLANEVARGIGEAYPHGKVGIYAYNEHSPAPTVAVDPRVIVSVATSFIKGGFTVDQLLDAWQAKGATVGIRDYMSVWLWAKDYPGQSRANDLDYLFRTIPHYHAQGARFWRAESTPSWAANGLGLYLVSRLLWDVEAAQDREALLADFFGRSFGKAAEPMRRYFDECLLAQARAPLSEDLVGRMYRHLEAALSHTDRLEERQRIGDFVLYTRYLELAFNVKGKPRRERRSILAELGNFSYRARRSHMLSGRWILREFRKPNDAIDPIAATAPAGEHPLKQNDEPITEEELKEYVARGIADNRLLDFTPRSFEGPLRPFPAARRTGAMTDAEAPAPVVLVGSNRFYLYMDQGGAEARFDVKVISKNGNRGPARVALYPPDEDEETSPLASAEAPADRRQHTVRLSCTEPGLYRVEITAPGNTEISWPQGQRVAMPQETLTTAKLVRQDFFFYVPGGTKEVSGYSANRSGRIFSPDGRVLHSFERQKAPEYFSISVPDGLDGAWWQMKGVAGEKRLMNVPAFLARRAEEGLVPRDALPGSIQ